MSVWKLEQQMKEEIAEAIKPIEDAIRAKWEPKLREAQEAAKRRLLDKQAGEYQAALKAALWPVGTKLVEWSNREKRAWSCVDVQWRKTGRTGFYDIFDERRHPRVKPMVWHAVPFVRLAKRDGTPGLISSDKWGVTWTNWLPEGEEPHTYKHPAKQEGSTS